MPQIDIQAALKDGYSPSEILAGLHKAGMLDRWDIDAARKDGFSDDDILGGLAPEFQSPQLDVPKGDTARGFKRAFAQVPELLYGTGALIGLSAENLFGEGGISTATKEYFADKFQKKQQENQKYAPTVEFDTALDNLKGGDVGSMADWIQDSAGYVVGQGLQALATGGVGAVIGKSALTKMLGGMAAKSAEKIVQEAAKKGVQVTLEQATKAAATRMATAIGAGAALGAQNLSMEAGDIYGGLIEESEKNNTPITGEDLLRAWGSAAVAAGTETATDLLGLGALTGRIKIPGARGRAARGAVAAGIGLPIEAGQEWVQTGLEQYGAGKPLDSPGAARERLNAAAVGGLGGAVVGGAAGVLSPTPHVPEPNTPKTDTQIAEDIISQPTLEGAINETERATSEPIPVLPTNDPRGTFSQVDDLASFVADEKANTDEIRSNLLKSQQAERALKQESALESADARVEGQRLQETQAKRLEMLDAIYADENERTPGLTFLGMLEREFPNNPLPTPQEKAIIAKRDSARKAFAAPDIVPAVPNEADFGIKQPKAAVTGARPVEAQLAQVNQFIASGFKPISGGRLLANEQGKKLMLTKTQREYVKSLPPETFQIPALTTPKIDNLEAPVVNQPAQVAPVMPEAPALPLEPVAAPKPVAAPEAGQAISPSPTSSTGNEASDLSQFRSLVQTLVNLRQTAKDKGSNAAPEIARAKAILEGQPPTKEDAKWFFQRAKLHASKQDKSTADAINAISKWIAGQTAEVSIRPQRKQSHDTETIFGAIKAMGGISLEDAQTITGEKSPGKMKGYPVGVFRKDGKTMDEIARSLAQDYGFRINTEDVDGGVAETIELIQHAANLSADKTGTTIYSMAREEREASAASQKKYMNELLSFADEYGVEVKGRPIEDVERDLHDAIKREIAASGEAFSETRNWAISSGVSEEELSVIEDGIAQKFEGDTRPDMMVRMYNELEDAIREVANGREESVEGGKDVVEDQKDDGASQESRPPLELEGQTQAQLLAEETRKALKATQDAAESMKAAADAVVKSFTLTGSTRDTDQAAARGQQDLLNPEQRPAPPVAESRQAPVTSEPGNAGVAPEGGASESAKQPEVVYNVGHEVRQDQGRFEAPGKTAEGQLNLFPATPIPGSPVQSLEKVVVEPERVGTRKVAFSRIRTPGEAASVFQDLNRSPMEKFQVLGLDERNKPIAFFDLFSGTLSQTSVYPREVWTAIYQTPGIKRVWIAHQHPSGVPTASPADKHLTRALREALTPDIGVTLLGHLIITKNKTTLLDQFGESESKIEVAKGEPKYTLPIIERKIVKDESRLDDTLTSPRLVRAFFRDFKPETSGLLVLSVQNSPIGWWPMSTQEMSKLRTGDAETGMAALMRKVGRNNAGAVIAYSPEPNSWATETAVANVGNALGKADVKMLDAITLEVNGELKSFAEIGHTLQSGGPFFSRTPLPAPIFYSALSRAIDSANSKELPSVGWKAFIQGAINKGVVKRAEVEWTGINDWLSTQQGRIPKERVSAFLDQGGVRVTEEILGANANKQIERFADSLESYEADEGALDAEEYPEWAEAASSITELINEAGRAIRSGNIQEAKSLIRNASSIEQDFGDNPDIGPFKVEFEELFGDGSASQSGTKFSEYQIPGSVPGSYREIVLTLPQKSIEYEGSENVLHGFSMARFGRSFGDLTPAQQRIALDETAGSRANKTGDFTSSHYPDAGNYLAHARVNDRVLPDGRKTLFIEEIQSDRAQKGRKEGFNVPVTMPDGTLRTPTTGIAPAPFVTKTDSWTALVLKRLLRYAAEGDYDVVAWTRGDQQVERYASALRKAVDVIEWEKTPEGVQIVGYKGKLTQGVREAGITGSGIKVVDTTEKESALSDAIGKSMADKIRNDPNQSGVIEGDDITVSDTGMAGYYDNILPKVAQDVAKKIGGGRVVEITLDQGSQQQAIEITPSMREKIMEGLPLFSRRIWRDQPDKQDFLVPETPEYDGNMSGDLAYTPRSAAEIEQLPIRLTVGEARGAHRGFGMLHMAKEGDADARRKAPSHTEDEAENYARQVALLARSFDEIYTEGDRTIFRSSRLKEAVVTQRITDDETGESYYSAVTIVPAENPAWGNPVWRAGRAQLPNDRTLKPVAPHPSPDQESQQSGRQTLGGPQTERFDLSKAREKLQVQRKEVSVSYKRRRVVRAKDDPQFSRADNLQPFTFKPNEANREKTDKIQAELKRKGYDFTITPVDLRDDVAKTDEGPGARNDLALAEKISGIFGKEIVWMAADGQFPIRAIVSPGALSKYIFIDARASSPAHSLAGHELAHHMEYDAPGIYRMLKRSLTGLIQNERQYRQKYGLPESMEDTKVADEIIGDLMGDGFGDPEFWNLVAKHTQSKGIFRLIANTITKWINKVSLKLKLKGLGSGQFVTDLKAAREALAKAVADYAEIQKGGETKDGNIGFSRGTEFNESEYRPEIVSWAREKWGDKTAPDGSLIWQNFVKWFGDSKVVDVEGRPLVVYHGTNRVFSQFKTREFGALLGKGAYFAANPESANAYANYEGGRVIPLYVSLKNPITVDSVLVNVQPQSELEAEGYDGLLLENKDGSIKWAVAFRPEQIKSSIGNQGTFIGPDIRFSRAEWINQQPATTQEALRKAGVWHVPPTLKDRVKEWSVDWQKRLKQGVLDQFGPIKEYDYHAYLLARMTRGADNALDGLLHYGTVYLDQDGAVDVNFESGGFLGIMSKLNGEHDRFLAWVVGNRADRLLAEGREHNFTPQDVQRLKALNQGNMPDGSNRDNEYARIKADLDRYNKAVLDIAEKAGLIDGASRSAWEKDFYVPFYRLMEDQTKGPILSKGLVNQYAFKVLKGGEQVLGDPMENILKNWSHLLDASLKNQAARESLLAAQRIGAVVEGPEETVRQMAKAAGLKDAVVSFTDQGAQRWFMVEDAFLLDAIKGIGFTGFQGAGMKVMQKFKKWLTIGVTVSPTFRIRNVIRDSLQMIGANPASYNVLDNVLTGWKATKEGSTEFASILVGGGVMRFGTILDGNRAEHVKRLVESGVEDKTILTTPQRVRDAMQQAWDWWQHVGDRAENVNRAALYKKLRAEGKTHLEASFAARDTMDFSMQGTWAAVRFLSQTVPFFNARLQGLYKLGRGAAEDPRRFGIVVGGAAIASLALLLAYKDDEDWKKREDWDRETFWWFKIGDKAFRIPKPFEIGAIATIAERGAEAVMTDELTGKQFAQRVFSIVSQQLSMNPVPQMAMPLIELYANRDSFTDRPIEGMGMERLSKEMRAGPNTSATAQLLGKNGLVSPVQIDHLVNGYFGWLGSHIVSTADLALRPAMDLPGKPAWRIDDVLVVGDFVKDLPAYQSKYVTRVYDQMREVQQAMADLKELQKIGAAEEAKKLMEDKGDKIRLYRLYKHTEKQLTDINRRIKMVKYAGGSAEDKRERLNSLYAARDRIARVTEERARLSQR